MWWLAALWSAWRQCPRLPAGGRPPQSPSPGDPTAAAGGCVSWSTPRPPAWCRRWGWRPPRQGDTRWPRHRWPDPTGCGRICGRGVRAASSWTRPLAGAPQRGCWGLQILWCLDMIPIRVHPKELAKLINDFCQSQFLAKKTLKAAQIITFLTLLGWWSNYCSYI